MTYRPGFRDFFQDFRGRECLVVYSVSDPREWWIAPLLEDGNEGRPFEDLTDAEEETLGSLVWKVADDWSSDQ